MCWIRNSLAFLLVMACSAADWNSAAALGYLDGAMASWIDRTGKDTGSKRHCVSCHTSLPYVFARPDAPYARMTIDAVKERVRSWNGPPYYPGVANASRGTESVLFALLLSFDDARQHRTEMSAYTHAAFRQMWTEQNLGGPRRGAWDWFSFKLDPWETDDSAYFGAALAAVAVGYAPQGSFTTRDALDGIARLKEHLSNTRSGKPLHSRLPLLWASARFHEILSSVERADLMEELARKQSADGGWTLAALGPWMPHPAVSPVQTSDAYATAFTAFVLQESGVASNDKVLSRAVTWLKQHQGAANGAWVSSSMNKVRGETDPAKNFMSDAATAWAVMVLSR